MSDYAEEASGDRNITIAYPDDGTRKTDLAKGKLHIDFWEGIATLPDDSQVNLKRSLKVSSQKFIRSLSFRCGQDCKVTLGREGSGQLQLFVGPEEWHCFENIEVTEALFETTFTPTPDEIDFQLISSSSRRCLYRGPGGS